MENLNQKLNAAIQSGYDESGRRQAAENCIEIVKQTTLEFHDWYDEIGHLEFNHEKDRFMTKSEAFDLFLNKK